MKSVWCRRVHAFADGELPVGAMEDFQNHLLDCTTCPGQLELIFGLNALAETAPGLALAPVTSMTMRAVKLRPRWIWGAGLGLAALAAAVLLWIRPGRQADFLAWDLGPIRPMEARLSDPRADRHRRYDLLRGGATGGHVRGAGGGMNRYAGLAELQSRGDVKGLVSRLLLDGEVEAARQLLSNEGQRRDLDNERAVVALLEQRPEEALRYLEAILATNPRSPQALWNRALILRDMGLGYAAAAAFGQVAALGEVGWSEEARVWTTKLRQQAGARKSRWVEAEKASGRLAEALELPSDALVDEFPDLVRSDFYLALRRAATAPSLAKLATLAHRLDQHYGGENLGRLVRRIQQGDLAKRAKLVTDYAAFSARHWTETQPGERAQFERQLRAAGAGAGDLLFGFLLETAVPGNDEQLTAVATALGDPWLEILVVEARAGAKNPRLDESTREAQLVRATELASREHLPLRRLKLQKARAYLLLNQYRLREADPLVREIRTAAQALGFWKLEITTLMQLAHLAAFRGSIAALEAFREEIILDGAGCSARMIIQGRLAERAIEDGDLARAQRALDDRAGCPGDATLEITGLSTLSELASADPKGPAAIRFPKALASARPRLSAADQLMATAFEGRTLMQSNPTEARRILTSVIQSADQMKRGDLDAIKPRLLAYRRLITQAVQSHDLERALQAMAAESDLTVPTACVLGLSEDMRRVSVVARGAQGEWAGNADLIMTPALVPEQIVDPRSLHVLQGCPEVAVIALPPFHGRARLLPATIAWRHHGRGPAGDRMGERRMVVSDVAPPPGLAMLPAWQPTPGSVPLVHLRGPEANPTRVLAAMKAADLVEFHVHGLVDASDASYLALAPDEHGASALTAGQVRGLRLPRRPLVVLAACDSASNSQDFPSYSGHWSLPSAFIEAGARAVLASTTDIPDGGASAFFAEVVGRIEAGAPAARALRDVRVAWLGRPGNGWVDDVVLFE
jgi:hypothetical protein